MTYPNMSTFVSNIRVYNEPDGYEKKLPYTAIVTVTHLSGEVVYLSGGIGELNRVAWEDILELLRNTGIKNVMLERHGKIKTIAL